MTSVRTGFIIRLIAGLAIAAPVVFRFATTELAHVRPSHARINLAQTIPARPGITQAGLEPAGNPGSLMQAFASRPSELLWSGMAPLAARGGDTIENVRLAAEAVDFAAVHPREIFSFNDIVGRRCEERGYRPGLMYSNGELVTGIGGGICILSTLLYNGALETGLRIVERHPHSGPVSYAPPGRDAAVSFGWADMRFKNNTDNLLLIRTKAQGDELVVAFYGTKQPDRGVEIVSADYEEIPYKIFEKEDETVPEGEVVVKQKARPGFAVTTIRLIRQDGKLVSREVISRDAILPRHKIVLAPPKEQPISDRSSTPDIVRPQETVSQPDAAPVTENNTPR